MGLRCIDYYLVVFLIWLGMILWLYWRDTLDGIGVTGASSAAALGVMIAMVRRFRLLRSKGIAVFKKRRQPHA
jgi:hypothetical protein